MLGRIPQHHYLHCFHYDRGKINIDVPVFRHQHFGVVCHCLPCRLHFAWSKETSYPFITISAGSSCRPKFLPSPGIEEFKFFSFDAFLYFPNSSGFFSLKQLWYNILYLAFYFPDQLYVPIWQLKCISIYIYALLSCTILLKFWI